MVDLLFKNIKIFYCIQKLINLCISCIFLENNWVEFLKVVDLIEKIIDLVIKFFRIFLDLCLKEWSLIVNLPFSGCNFIWKWVQYGWWLVNVDVIILY